MKTALCASIRKFINGTHTWLKYIPQEGSEMVNIALLSNSRKYFLI
jgi:hypothetical protein